MMQNIRLLNYTPRCQHRVSETAAFLFILLING
jgi:hypothetical protein